EPSQALFNSLEPGETGHAEVLVYSTIWEAFTIQSIQGSLPQISWTSRAATEAELASVSAKSGYQLSIEVAADIPIGEFIDTLTLSLQPNIDIPPVELPVTVSGTKHGRISILGPQIDD